jgi:hypothetical protein
MKQNDTQAALSSNEFDAELIAPDFVYEALKKIEHSVHEYRDVYAVFVSAMNKSYKEGYNKAIDDAVGVCGKLQPEHKTLDDAAKLSTPDFAEYCSVLVTAIDCAKAIQKLTKEK